MSPQFNEGMTELLMPTQSAVRHTALYSSDLSVPNTVCQRSDSEVGLYILQSADTTMLAREEGWLL